MSDATPIIKRGPTKIQIIDEQIESLENELIAIGGNASSWQIGHIRIAIKKLKDQRTKLLAEQEKTSDKNKQTITPEMMQAYATNQTGTGMD